MCSLRWVQDVLPFVELAELTASSVALPLAASAWHACRSQNARFCRFARACKLIGTRILLSGTIRGSTRRAFVGLAVVAFGAAFTPTRSRMRRRTCLVPARKVCVLDRADVPGATLGSRR
mgnify:CR=1 FL=1